MTLPPQSMTDAMHAMLDRRVRQKHRIPDNGQAHALRGTPERWWRAIDEMTDGYQVDIEALLSVTFNDVPSDEMVILQDVPFTSLCEHHLFPFTGTASVAYMPQDDRVVGLSKLARVVEAHARRLQVQERMTYDIAAALFEHITETSGAACVVKGQHACMSCRGVRKSATMVTSTLLGVFRDDTNIRNEFLRLAITN